MTALYLVACLAIPPTWALGFGWALGRLEARRRRAARGATRPPVDYHL